MPPRWGSATVEKVATNAVMAGCKPEYFPVIVAGVRAVSAPAFNLHTSETSTGAHAQMFIVNGPIRRELDINCGSGLLGPRVQGERDHRARPATGNREYWGEYPRGHVNVDTQSAGQVLVLHRGA